MLRRERPQCSSTQLDSPAVFLEDSLEVGSLDPAGELGGDLRERAAVVEIEMERFIVASDDLRRQVFGLDQGAAGGDGCLLEGVFELADVARPVVAQEPGESLSRERFDGQAFLGDLVEEVVDQERDVFQPLAQRGHVRSIRR